MAQAIRARVPDAKFGLPDTAGNPEWYAATIGGMGLTGFISWAELRLRPIVSRAMDYRGEKFVGLDEFFSLAQIVSDNTNSTVMYVIW